MDTTPGCTCAFAALNDNEHTKLQCEGRCFRCKHQGHISRYCPEKLKDSKAHATEGEDTTINAGSSNQTTTQKPATKINTKELVALVHNMDQDKKDKVIQDIFTQEDFA